MKYRIILPEEQRVTSWSGGQTRELYIAGGQADYAARDFLLRLSSATVETKRSVFTSLPAYHRALMPLDGTIHLTHDEEPEIRLVPFQTDVFDGGARTVSEGECQDFNVMWHKDAPFSVILEALAAYPCQQTGASLDFYYAYRSTFHLKTGGEDLTISPGRLLCLWQAEEIYIKADESQQAAPIIHVAIH